MDQTTATATPAAPAPVAAPPTPEQPTTATAGPDLVDTARPADVPSHPSVLRAHKLIDDLRAIETDAERTPNLGATVARLAGLLAGVLEEAAAEFEHLAGRG